MLLLIFLVFIYYEFVLDFDIVLVTQKSNRKPELCLIHLQ